MHLDFNSVPHQGNSGLRRGYAHSKRQFIAGQRIMIRHDRWIATVASRMAPWVAACTSCVLLMSDLSLAQDAAAPDSSAQPAAPPTEPQATGSPPLIRRLTESQYRASIADIFGSDIAIVGRFEPGLRAEGLLAVGTSQAGISSFAFEQYDASAQGIAAAVVSEERRSKLVPCQPHSQGRFDDACAKQFVQHYGQALF